MLYIKNHDYTNNNDAEPKNIKKAHYIANTQSENSALLIRKVVASLVNNILSQLGLNSGRYHPLTKYNQNRRGGAIVLTLLEVQQQRHFLFTVYTSCFTERPSGSSE